MEKIEYLYARVSDPDQNEARQIEAFKDLPGELLLDKQSGRTLKFAERNNGGFILDQVKKGKVASLTVEAVDRLGRNTVDILTTIEFLKENGVLVVILNPSLQSLDKHGNDDPIFNLMVGFLSTLAQQFVEDQRRKQAAGIALAKDRGVYKGRKKGSKNKDYKCLVDKYPEVVECLKAEMSIRKTAQVTKRSKSTVENVKREMAA